MVVEKLHPMCLSSEVDFVTGPEISADHCIYTVYHLASGSPDRFCRLQFRRDGLSIFIFAILGLFFLQSL